VFYNELIKRERVREKKSICKIIRNKKIDQRIIFDFNVFIMVRGLKSSKLEVYTRTILYAHSLFTH